MATCRQAAAGGGGWRGAVGQPDNPCIGTNSPVESEYQQLVSRRTVKLLAACPIQVQLSRAADPGWLPVTAHAEPSLSCTAPVL